MSALDIAADGIVKETGVSLATIRARAALEALETAGYRILAPGELDSETLEAAAKEADDIALAVNEAPSTRCVEDAIQNASIEATAEDIALRIRNLRSAR